MWKTIALGLAIALGIAAVVIRLAEDRFVRTTDREIIGLLAAGTPSTKPIEEKDLVELPPPVQRWLTASGVIGTRIPQSVRLQQEGDLRLDFDRGWMAFRAEQYYTLDPPAFLWRVTVTAAPGVRLRGVDSFRDGQGSMRILPWALFPIVNATGSTLDQGSALRYLQETIWFPAAALSPAISWTPMDDRTSRATLSVEGAVVSGVFSFDENGRVVDFRAERYRDGDGLRVWRTPLRAHEWWNGILVPTEGDGIWMLEKEFNYIRLRIIALDYDVHEVFPRR